MKDILIFIFSFYFCLISVLAYGEIFHKVFLKKLKTIENVNIYSGFYGLMFLTLISLFTSLFVPHNFYHNILIHGFGFIYFFLSNFKKKM